MTRLSAALLLLVLAVSAFAFQPRTGQWWDPNESGSGYNFDIQEGVLIMTGYSYQTGGAAQWYLSSGPMTNGQHNFTGTLDKYINGQCISCPYAGRPTLTGNDGPISITFASETSATLTLPGGRVTQIQPFNFATGDPPNGLLGEWIFVYDIGTNTYAQRFDLTTVQPPTSTGNGIAVDLTRMAACELQVSGQLAGAVVCAQGDVMGNLLSAYYFRFGLDQTYGGLTRVPPTTSGTIYPMKGFKVVSRCGCANTSADAADHMLSSGAERQQLAPADDPITTDAAKQTILEALSKVIRQALAQ